MALSVPYFFASPFWGHTCDHWVQPKFIQPIGHVLTIIGFVILGPAGYIPYTVSTYIVGRLLDTTNRVLNAVDY